MKPYVVCHMEISLDGRIHPSRWSESPDGDKAAWGKVYERVHHELAGDGWLIGRITAAEMSKARTLPTPSEAGHTGQATTPPPRPLHRAASAHKPYAIALDPHARVPFDQPDLGGDAVIVLLGHDVCDAHLAGLTEAGVSYWVCESPELDVPSMLQALQREFGVERLLLEGGGKTCGALLEAGVVDEISLLIAPAIDGAPGVDGVFDVRDPAGLKGKVKLRFLSAQAVEHGQVQLRYAVSPA